MTQRFKKPVIVGDSVWTDPDVWADEDLRGSTAGGSSLGEFIDYHADVAYEDLEGLGDTFEGEDTGPFKKAERGRRTTLAKFPGIEMDEEDPGPPTYVYHMTPTKNLPSILKRGLTPRNSGQFNYKDGQITGIYTARYPEDVTAMAVLQYSITDGDKGWGPAYIDSKQTMLKIKVRAGMRMIEDPGFDLEVPIYIFLDKIPATAIQVVDTIDLESF